MKTMTWSLRALFTLMVILPVAGHAQSADDQTDLHAYMQAKLSTTRSSKDVSGLLVRNADELRASMQRGLQKQAMGTNSGGGQGDHAMAFAEIMQSHPGLKPDEILLEAFKESQGRIPTNRIIHRGTPGDSYSENSGNIVSEHYGSYTILYNFSKDINDSRAELTPESIYIGKTSIRTQQDVSSATEDSGPLVPATKPLEKPWTINLGINFDRNEYASLTGFGGANIYTSSTGLVTAEPGAPNLEFRQYSADIVVWVLKADPVRHKCFNLPKSSGSSPNVNGYCAIGYFWNKGQN
ncbi:MAG TPA: hypothetical protein VF412_03220 [Bdellovibrio sp.]|uniref:hypothetical protein n=1 Tax=Bdellovibrio sp. TaxID=28201 RepID=UPI002F1527CF